MAEWEEMKQMSLIEMDGFLKGKCIPRDLKVNETNAEYLVRKFGELESKLETALREFRSAGVTIDNLEDKCSALAAENAGLKAGILQASEDMEAHHDDYALFSYDADGEQMDALLRLCDAQDSIASLEDVKTPATDAFLAEVRASELDSLAGLAETMLVKFSNQQCSSDMHEVVGWKMVLQQANNRASQLRKGGNQ
ncbi:TPA: hypothetical protein MJQ39_004082 [Salmonella enterica subsp. enterica serovar Bredeney]|nr:hypothetical protein [Salmonella enterica subsp. enterica serovar Bredeney]